MKEINTQEEGKETNMGEVADEVNAEVKEVKVKTKEEENMEPTMETAT